MLQVQAGPANIFGRLRRMIDNVPMRDGSLSDGFYCFYCLSIWVALLLNLIVFTDWKSYILMVLATSAIAIFLNLLHEN